MSLIECPECRKEVSDTVDSCIHCGFTLSKEVEANQVQASTEIPASEGKEAGSTINHNKESKTEKVHKFLDKALVVKTEGEYSGEWRLDVPNSLFFREREEPSSKENHTNKVIKESFPMSNIGSVENLSETKSVSGIAKGAIVGAIIAGPVGALAAGAFMGSKNSIFVEIMLQNEKKLHAHISQIAYENILTDIRSRETQPNFSEITTTISGEDDLSSFNRGCFIIFAILMGFSFILMIIGEIW